MQVPAYAIDDPKGKFHRMEITRRNVGENDVLIEILYTGICHSDIHQARNEWSNSHYPMVPGHEIVGRIKKVGTKVSKVKEGQLVGVGCFVDSCRDCKWCKENKEQHCKKGAAFTYNSFMMDKKTPTYGGYSTHLVVDEKYTLKLSDKFTKLEGVAPLLCAGITTFSPLRAHQDKVGPGKKVGVVGLGGLGHMGVKFAASMGADVTVFSTSPRKEADAKRLGAKGFVISKDEKAMKEVEGTFDFILDTVSAKHEIRPYIQALSPFGVLGMVGANPEPYQLYGLELILTNKTIFGSSIGGIKETQEMLDYCADHDIRSDVEVIGIDKLEEAYERTIKSDVKYRFVIDINSIKTPQSL